MSKTTPVDFSVSIMISTAAPIDLHLLMLKATQYKGQSSADCSLALPCMESKKYCIYSNGDSNLKTYVRVTVIAGG